MKNEPVIFNLRGREWKLVLDTEAVVLFERVAGRKIFDVDVRCFTDAVLLFWASAQQHQTRSFEATGAREALALTAAILQGGRVERMQLGITPAEVFQAVQPSDVGQLAKVLEQVLGRAFGVQDEPAAAAEAPASAPATAEAPAEAAGSAQ